MSKSKETMKFSEWLAKHYKVKVRDFGALRVPWFWRKFTSDSAMALRGKEVYVRDLDKMREKDLIVILWHEIRGHIVRQRKLKWPIYLLMYGVSKRFRCNDEIAAYTYTMEAAHFFGFVLDVSPEHISKKLRRNYFVGKRQEKRALKKLRKNRSRVERGEFTEFSGFYKIWSEFSGLYKIWSDFYCK